MASLEQLIRQNINPFDSTTFTPGNFWKETQNEDQEVASIHQEVIDSIEQTLDALMRDHRTRTLMLLGDSGSGKSHLLGRLKRRLNNKACFAYVGPWPDSQFIWRHVLRQTVDSLLEVPEGQSDPQLICWLQGLEILKDKGIAKRLLGERSVFVRDLYASFPSGLYRAKEFFGVLYDLLNPELRMTAYDWLRGEDLDEEDLKLLRVKRSVDSEDAAQKMLANFGRIAGSTQPIVICFDNLDNIPKLPNGKPDLQALFNVNSTIHNEKLSNFLILVSIITSNWRKSKEPISHADRARINEQLTLRNINLDQAAALWSSRLHPLHMQADPPPTSSVAPLTKDWLIHRHPGGKVAPRTALMLAEQLIREFKVSGELPPIDDSPAPPIDPPSTASFELVWQQKFKEIGQSLSRIAQFSSPELIRRLQEALEALAIPGIQPGVLPSKAYSSYSLGHQLSGRAGIVWIEDGNLSAFANVMKACKKVLEHGARDRLYLIRSGRLGNPSNRGYQLFQEIFATGGQVHIKPDLESVQYLEAYHRLVNAAAGGELVIGSQTPNVQQLQSLIRESKALDDCTLLQKLKGEVPPPPPPPLETAKAYISNRMATQLMLGLQALIDSTQEHIPDISAEDIDSLVQDLCNANQLQILDPNARRENQLLCWVPG